MQGHVGVGLCYRLNTIQTILFFAPVCSFLVSNLFTAFSKALFNSDCSGIRKIAVNVKIIPNLISLSSIL